MLLTLKKNIAKKAIKCAADCRIETVGIFDYKIYFNKLFLIAKAASFKKYKLA